MARSRRFSVLLYTLLGVAVLVLAGVAVVLWPILTHTSAGPSGQEVPDGYVSETSAEGADGRVREVRVETPDGEAARLDGIAPGDRLIVSGSGFDSGIGIYVSVCAIPEPGQKPTPCLGGVPEHDPEAQEEQLASVWITDDWAWRAFATQRYDDAETGSFRATLTVPEPADEGIDCREQRCAITTRSDHTAGSDRVQDIQLPVSFAE